MRHGQPSATAFGAARHRALHQDLDGGTVFGDPLAWSILGADRDWVLAQVGDDPRRALRLFVAARHRLAEDRVHAAIQRGVTQVVVLGAGLDTFACRNADESVMVFEVDHPATGEWKRRRLAESGIRIPDTVRFVATDFDDGDLMVALRRADFDDTAPAIVMWLGVIPYLSGAALTATLRQLGALRCEIVADYRAPLAPSADAVSVEATADLARRTAAVGEPLSEPIPPTTMAAMLRDNGFAHIDDLDRSAIRTRLLRLQPVAHAGGGHIVIAATESSA